LDHGVEVVERDQVALEHVRALAGLGEVVLRAAPHHAGAVLEEEPEHLAHRQQARRAVDDHHVVDRERGLELRVLVEPVQHRLRLHAPFQLEDDAHPLPVGLVAQGRDLLDLLRAHELGDGLDQRGLVDLVGDLGHDDRHAAAALLDAGAAAHADRAAARLQRLPDALAGDHAAGGEVGALDVLHQGLDRGRGVVDQRHERVDHLAHVVGREVRGHAHRDAGGAVDDQVRYRRGQHLGLGRGAVEVLDEVDGVLVDVREHRLGHGREARLGVAVSRWRVAVHRPEVALAVGQRVAQVPGLRQPAPGVVDRLVAVRVVLADHLADHAGALRVLPVRRQTHLVHGVQDAALDRLQTVADVRQRAVDDDRHRVVDEAAPQLVRDLYRDDFSFVHEPSWPARSPREAPSSTDGLARREATLGLTPESNIRVPSATEARMLARRGTFAAVIDRYSTPEMKALWSEAERYRAWRRVDLAATEALGALGEVPRATAGAIRRAVAERPLDEAFAARVAEREAVTRHDVVAFPRALSERVGEPARFVHYGLTSTDVVDTAQNSLLVRAVDLIAADLEAVIARLRELAAEH